MSDMALHMKTLEIEFFPVSAQPDGYAESDPQTDDSLNSTISSASSGKRIFGSSRPRIFPFCPTFTPCWKRKRRPTRRIRYIVIWQCCCNDAAAGSDSFLWNGHTTLEANSRFILPGYPRPCKNASDNVKRTQYLNLLSWCWEEMSRDRNERCLLVCDEAYLMIDPQVPQSLCSCAMWRSGQENMKLDWRSFLIPWWISWPRRSKCTGRPFGYSVL